MRFGSAAALALISAAGSAACVQSHCTALRIEVWSSHHQRYDASALCVPATNIAMFAESISSVNEDSLLDNSSSCLTESTAVVWHAGLLQRPAAATPRCRFQRRTSDCCRSLCSSDIQANARFTHLICDTLTCQLSSIPEIRRPLPQQALRLIPRQLRGLPQLPIRRAGRQHCRGISTRAEILFQGHSCWHICRSNSRVIRQQLMSETSHA